MARTGFKFQHPICYDGIKMHFSMLKKDEKDILENLRRIYYFINNKTDKFISINNVLYPFFKDDSKSDYNKLLGDCIWILDISYKCLKVSKDKHEQKKVIKLNECIEKTIHFMTNVLYKYIFESNSNILNKIPNEIQNEMKFNYFRSELSFIKEGDILSKNKKSSCANIEILVRYTKFLETMIGKDVSNLFLENQKLLKFPRINKDIQKHFFSLNPNEKKVVYGKCSKNAVNILLTLKKS